MVGAEQKEAIAIGKEGLEFKKCPLIMGVLNVTPDSFSDGGIFYDIPKAIERGRQMVAEGADIVDVGGESTRPGTEPIPIKEEMSRVVPVIQALSEELGIPISIDTYKSAVAEAAIDAGATMVNDITALRYDPHMVELVASRAVAVVLMHMKGMPKDMQINPHYDDLIGEITGYLRESIEKAESSGVRPDAIVVDPGIGFGKTAEHNLLILKNLQTFKTLGKPILLGTSRKSFIGKVLDVHVNEREEGTAATVAVGIMNGANILRVHDVARMFRVVKMTHAIMKAGKGS